jgi:peptide deformylase
MARPAGVNRRIVMLGNPALRGACRPVKDITPDVRKLIADLKKTMLEQEGLGLAANQIAEPLAVFAVNPKGADQDHEPYCIINPRLVATEGSIEREEGCLSIPEVYDVVTRPEFVRVTGLDEDGNERTFEAGGMLARAFAHEMNHLEGVLFIDHLSPVRRKMLASRLAEIEAQERACT